MTLEDFKDTLAHREPPPNLSPLLTAMWHDAHGNWERAHEIAQDIEDQAAAWVHAYLHRKEGDLGNAGYWYRRAGRPTAGDSLEAEWDRITTALLAERV